ncbi:MAG: sortase [Eubacteriales bacterium]|nr:sortase [Eubacteriales bacterium]MDY5347507.1 sortase [Eubacteriales bacterium]
MPKKAGIALLAAGAVLIGSALLLLLHNGREDRFAKQESERLLESVRFAIRARVTTEVRVPTEPPETQPGETTAADVPSQPDETEPKEMPTVELDGQRYLGVLEIPALELSLPVMADWDYDRLRRAPCRQFGSLAESNLVIAGHNYKNHFARLRSLKPGDAVTFIDMNGVTHAFSVAAVEILAPESVEDVQNSGYPLTLYTCTTGAKSRVVVFCSAV